MAAPQVVAQLLDDSRGKRYAARIGTWRMRASATKKDELALVYGWDGRTLLKAVYAAASSDPDVAFLARQHQAGVLRVVLVQDYLTAEASAGGMRSSGGRRMWRVSRRADPGSPRRMTSMPGGASSATHSGMATRCTSPGLATPAPPPAAAVT